MTDTAPAQTRTPNAELAYRVLDHIDADPDSWFQETWLTRTDCGTIACFAGWTCLLSGDDPVFDDETETDTVDVAVVGLQSIPERAAHLLGIPFNRRLRFGVGHVLFDAEHDRKSLGEAVEHYFGPRPDPQS
jgi:hypothetical protein